MDAKFKKADALKAGDVFAMKNSDISFHKATVISVAERGDLEVEVKYEFALFGTTHLRRELLPGSSYVIVME